MEKVKTPTIIPAKRQRAKSMFADPSLQLNVAGQKKMTLDDMHAELATEYGSYNRGLRPAQEREMPEPLPKKTTECKRILEEFMAKVQAKLAKFDGASK